MATWITSIPHRLAHWRASLGKRPFLSAAVLGAGLGVLASLGSVLLLSISLRLLPPEQWGNSAASSVQGLGPGMLFVFAVIVHPLIETVIGQLVPVEIGHRLGANPVMCVLLSALVFGGAHLVNGGLVHGINTFFAGLVFAGAYVALRRAGIGPGYVAASTAHAVHNMTLLFVIAPLFPNPL